MKKWIVVVAIGLVSMVSSLAYAAEPSKVATVNTARIFNDMQERKDLQAKMEADLKLLDGVDKEKREKLNALKTSRDALRSDSAQFKEKNAELLKSAIEYEGWTKINQANLQRDQKQQMKMLFDKIETAVGEVAKQKGIDLVLNDRHQEIPEDLDPLNINQLKDLINSRTVLYSGEKVDISNDVLALLDAKYRGAAKPAQP
jgi:Skp family chaperone for outer membrane proteins